ncbi:MAG: 3-phosphoshikimate 1-carboxyvinyltransferase [Planctomycetia bacterium]
MAQALPPAQRPLAGAFDVPPSKSLLQRALVLSALADLPCDLRQADGRPALGPGCARDVLELSAALEQLGRWQEGALGTSRASLVLDLGLGATGLRLCTALATLRPAGARTLVRGRPALLARPHRELRRALGRLGAHVVRKPSGAHRVIGGGMRGGEVSVAAQHSSQHLSALMLLAPRLGGLCVRVPGVAVSRPYLAVTAAVLRSFGIEVGLAGLAAPGGRIEVAGGVPHCEGLVVEPDASAAAWWWAAAALTGGRAHVPGLPAGSAQADAVLPALLARMGARVDVLAGGVAEVQGPPQGLAAAGEVDLRDAPDLLPLVAVLAAFARGRTRLVGLAHARGKESDRVARSAALLAALGIEAEAGDSDLVVQGGAPRAACLHAHGDHRLAFAAALAALRLPGTSLEGAAAVAKSHPSLWHDLEAATRA